MDGEKRPKRPAGIAYQYPSQEYEQIAAIRIGPELAEAFAKYQADTEAETGRAIDKAQALRHAVETVVDGGGPTKIVPKEIGDTAATIGPFRLPERYLGLPKKITAAAKRLECTEADLIRSAVTEWFTGKGYMKKRRA